MGATMTDAEVLAGLLVSMVGWILAALVLGLWLGERGRRRAAERYAVTGSPDDATPAAVSRAPAQEAEDRFRAAGLAVSQETVDRFFEDAVAQLKAEKIPFDPDQLRREIESQLMHGEDVLA